MSREIGIAPRQRGAWIETALGGGQRPIAQGIAPRQRGAWIETSRRRLGCAFWRASPLGNEGRGLKLFVEVGLKNAVRASPLGNEGRGLKLKRIEPGSDTKWHRPSATRGVD